jgi:hypothetical protein
MKIKTIDINVKEWFDKVNGNSYFAGTITINYGMKSEKVLTMPFQYGYGEHYKDQANALLAEKGMIDNPRYENGARKALWQYCRENSIILRCSKMENCKKKELLQF